MLFAFRRVNIDHFVKDLMAGDPVVWCILLGVIGYTAFSLYRKYGSFSKRPQPEQEF